jgi:hypothetical protein
VDPVRYDPVIVALDYRNSPEFTDLWDPASETYDALMVWFGQRDSANIDGLRDVRCSALE